MNIDIAKYENSKQFAINYFNSNGKDIGRTISNVASATFVPCIVVAYWLGPETNWHPDVVRAIQRFIDFYGYTEIQNKPEGSPI